MIHYGCAHVYWWPHHDYSLCKKEFDNTVEIKFTPGIKFYCQGSTLKVLLHNFNSV